MTYIYHTSYVVPIVDHPTALSRAWADGPLEPVSVRPHLAPEHARRPAAGSSLSAPLAVRRPHSVHADVRCCSMMPVLLRREVDLARTERKPARGGDHPSPRESVLVLRGWLDAEAAPQRYRDHQTVLDDLDPRSRPGPARPCQPRRAPAA